MGLAGYVADKTEKAIDWTLRQVAPRRAALRKHFKRMEQDSEYRLSTMAMLNARGYRNAKSAHSQTPFSGAGGSADRELLQDLPALCNRSDELRQDDPIASGIGKTLVDNIIGTGMRGQSRHKNPEVADQIEALWNKLKNNIARADDLTHGEHQRLIIDRVFYHGGILMHRGKRDAADPLFMEAIEIPRLRTPHGKLGDPNYRAGVERDAHGIRLRYHVLRQHPNDVDFRALKYETDALPAGECKHLRLNATRPGQTHGEPGLHSVMQDLRDLDLLLVAALERTQVAACLAAFIASDMPLDAIVHATAEKYGYKIDQKLEPGMLFRLNNGEHIESFVPNFPTPELEAFIVMLCRRIGAALGLSWQIILKDFSRANYSSARTDLLESRRVYRVLQDWFIEKYLNWEWESVLGDAILRGEMGSEGLTLEDIAPVYWIPNGWQWVDPVKEAQSAQMELEMGTTTLRDQCAQKGTDWQEVMTQRLREQKFEQDERKRLGLPEKVQPNAPGAAAPTLQEDKDEPDSPARGAYLTPMKVSA